MKFALPLLFAALIAGPIAFAETVADAQWQAVPPAPPVIHQQYVCDVNLPYGRSARCELAKGTVVSSGTLCSCSDVNGNIYPGYTSLKSW